MWVTQCVAGVANVECGKDVFPVGLDSRKMWKFTVYLQNNAFISLVYHLSYNKLNLWAETEDMNTNKAYFPSESCVLVYA